jgi:hypothetical protein
MNGCCKDEIVVAGREATAASNDTDGVLNGDCLLHESGVVSSATYTMIMYIFVIFL